MAEESAEIMPLTSVIARLPRVPESQKESMFLLYNRYFSNVSLTSFLHDMNEKDWVIQLRNGPNIVGFSTLQVLRLPVGGAERIFLFSGDTIVDQVHWQSSALAGSFGHFMLRLMADYECHPLYWFLISKGYRTYRFLPVYFKSFYPAYDRVTPPDYGALLHGVASRKFGHAYDAQHGLIRSTGQKEHLKPELCEIPESRRKDPHVRFFLEKNPAYCLGDELACIADIARENLNKYAWRVIENTAVEWNA